MRVLLIAANIFENVGGGETAYARIVREASNIEFTYFVTDKSLLTRTPDRPLNVRPAVLKPQRSISAIGDPLFPQYKLDALRLADQYARSVAGEDFDLVDIPDYYSFGAYLRSAFLHNGVHVKRIVLAMHGNLSTSISMNWDTLGSHTLSLEELEAAQFCQADAVYALSESYAREWRKRFDRPVHIIDPMGFVSYQYADCTDAAGSPSVYCIGRTERCKGNDIFLDILRWVGADCYSTAAHIGNIYRFGNGVGSDYHLDNLAKHRGLKVKYKMAISRQELNALFAGRAFVLLPVRYDTLNLVALEALFSGCPVAVSSKAGVCSYLDTNYPTLPYIKIDFDDFAAAVAEIRSALKNYDVYRRRLADALKTLDVRTDLAGDITAFYENTLAQNELTAPASVRYVERLTPVMLAKKLCFMIGLSNMRNSALRLRERGKDFCARVYIKLRFGGDPSLGREGTESYLMRKRYKWVASLDESSRSGQVGKLENTYSLCNHRLFRSGAYLEIARQHYKLGLPETAAAYELRAYRLLHRDPYSSLRRTIRSLQENGYHAQADAAELMYGSDSQEQAVYDHLKRKYERLLADPAADACEIVEEHRQGGSKIAIIVSLYNAADKLDFFISMLCLYPAIQDGRAEVVFVDSCSPSNEYQIIRNYIGKLSFLYIRSYQRETIQKAWNRGLGCVNTEYVTFLGVDELMYPDALDKLSAYLDGHPEVDWVVGNSLVSDVEKNGILRADIMLYDRAGGLQHSANLETCYLTYVGGLYRRSVHQRFGYYDEHYRGAGDTEFKNRVLPHIKVAYLDETLGVFLNYPEERVTASPMAEIEDLEAWYLYRTPGGIRYEYENEPIPAIEQTLKAALCYRKSFQRHMSMDIEYAEMLTRYLLERDPENRLAKTAGPSIHMLLQDQIDMEYVDHLPTRTEGARLVHRVVRDMKRASKEFQKAGLLGHDVHCPIMQDNRYEQHSYLWKPKIQEPGARD